MRVKKNDVFKFIAVLVTSIGTITALASLSTMNPTVALVTVVLIVVSGACIGVYYFVRRDNSSMKDVPGLEGSSTLSVRGVIDEVELKIIADLDEECYGEHSVNLQGLQDWWKRYPKGIYALFHNRKLIGAIGIWPLTKNAFESLADGRLMESRLHRTDIVSGKRGKQIYWYFGDIILEKKYRKKKLAPYLPQGYIQDEKFQQESLASYFLHNAVEEWLKEGNIAEKVKLCALGATPAGINLLERLGFTKTSKLSPDKLPIYIRITTLQEIQEDVQAIWGKSVSAQ